MRFPHYGGKATANHATADLTADACEVGFVPKAEVAGIDQWN